MPISITKSSIEKEDYTIRDTILKRDNIPTEYKRINMIVFVKEDLHYYRLESDLITWIDLGLSTKEVKAFNILSTLNNRNDILNRTYGMIIYVQEINRYYRLLKGLTNNDWEDLGETLSQNLKNYTIVSTITNRDLISVRSYEMVVFVQENSTYYTLLSGLTNSDWINLGYTLSRNIKEFSIVETLIERNNIPASQRKKGMIISVKQNNRSYKLIGNLKNSDWEDLGEIKGGFDSRDSLKNIGGAYQMASLRNAHVFEMNWTTRSTSGFDNNWFSVCWSPELGIFVAVAGSGASNRVMTSSDGINWTTRSTSGFDNSWISVCWSSELMLFVAVASSGISNRVMTSPDGINWTTRSTSGFDNNWNSVCWSPELGIFLAVAYSGSSNRVMTSPNGITWTIRTSAADNSWNSVTWSPELGIFAAVAYSGATNRVMTSLTDARITQYRPIYNKTFGYNSFANIFIKKSVINSDWQSICWSPELEIFVAVAEVGTNRVMTSNDGITWTPRITPVNVQWYSVTWSPELMIFVAVAGSGTNRVMTSSDGINWIIRTTPVDINFIWWYSVTWSPERSLFVAVGSANGNNKVMTSSNGINWTIRTALLAPSLYSVTWSPQLGLFVAVGNDNINQFIYSSDGINWTTGQISPVYQWTSVCWSPELRIFVAVSDFSTTNSNNRVMTSSDGINWTLRTTPSSTSGQNWKSVIWVSELKLFIAVGYSIMTSRDGITWTLASNSTSLGTNNFFTSITWSPKLGITLGVGKDYSTVFSTSSYVKNKPKKNKIY